MPVFRMATRVGGLGAIFASLTRSSRISRPLRPLPLPRIRSNTKFRTPPSRGRRGPLCSLSETPASVDFRTLRTSTESRSPFAAGNGNGGVRWRWVRRRNCNAITVNPEQPPVVHIGNRNHNRNCHHNDHPHNKHDHAQGMKRSASM